MVISVDKQDLQQLATFVDDRKNESYIFFLEGIIGRPCTNT